MQMMKLQSILLCISILTVCFVLSVTGRLTIDDFFPQFRYGLDLEEVKKGFRKKARLQSMRSLLKTTVLEV